MMKAQETNNSLYWAVAVQKYVVNHAHGVRRFLSTDCKACDKRKFYQFHANSRALARCNGSNGSRMKKNSKLLTFTEENMPFSKR